MELTAEEQKNWNSFNSMFSRGRKYPERINQIIKMSAEDKSLREIKKEVGGAVEIITETRMKARRRGII